MARRVVEDPEALGAWMGANKGRDRDILELMRSAAKVGGQRQEAAHLSAHIIPSPIPIVVLPVIHAYAALLEAAMRRPDEVGTVHATPNALLAKLVLVLEDPRLRLRVVRLEGRLVVEDDLERAVRAVILDDLDPNVPDLVLNNAGAELVERGNEDLLAMLHNIYSLVTTGEVRSQHRDQEVRSGMYLT